ncbi:MAG: hypothetical protein ACYC61_21685 [Isosphaeraceae bacterium]
MTQLDTEPTRARLRTPRARGELVPLLIQVPRVEPSPRRVRGGRPEEAGRNSSWRGGRRGQPFGQARPRRRLRREIRLTGCWILAMAAMGGTFTIGWMSRGARAVQPTARIAAAPAWGDGRSSLESAAADLPAAIEAVEAVPSDSVRDADISVILPGYLLPDDSREESAHEGS